MLHMSDATAREADPDCQLEMGICCQSSVYLLEQAGRVLTLLSNTCLEREQ